MSKSETLFVLLMVILFTTSSIIYIFDFGFWNVILIGSNTIGFVGWSGCLILIVFDWIYKRSNEND